ncbi:unnamed protein product, partial [marine sediment metagenome]
QPVHNWSKLLADKNKDETKVDNNFRQYMQLQQKELTRKYYIQKGLEPKELNSENKLSGILVPSEDYSGIPRNIFDVVRMLWIGSYSAFFKIGLPFSAFFHDKRLIFHFPFIFLWKSFMFLVSIGVVLFGILGICFSLKKWKDALTLLLILFYINIFYIAVFVIVRNIVINTRMGIPGLPYFIIFAVVGVQGIYRLLIKNRSSR